MGAPSWKHLQRWRSFPKKTRYSAIFSGERAAYSHYIPSAVKSIVAKEEFVTAYTPYQAEISQGILQSIFEYQTMICELTGMEVSNASVYDGASAAAEATAMCRERKRSRGSGIGHCKSRGNKDHQDLLPWQQYSGHRDSGERRGDGFGSFERSAGF